MSKPNKDQHYETQLSQTVKSQVCRKECDHCGNEYPNGEYSCGKCAMLMCEQCYYGDGSICSICEEKRLMMSALKTQIGGSHYKDCRIQPIEYIEANNLPFLEGSVVKRVTRHLHESGKGIEDIDKAIHELQLIKELRYGYYENDEDMPL